MTAIIIVLAVMLFFLIIALLRGGVIAEYSEEGFTLKVIAGPVRIDLIPGNDEKQEDKKKVKKQKKSKAPAKTDSAEKEQEKKGGPVQKIMTVLPTALQTLGRFFKHLQIDVLTVRYAITGDDPYDIAMTYGYANGALGYIGPLLNRNFKIKKWDVNVYPCFTEPEETMYIKAKATIAVWELVYIILKLDFKAIISIL